MIPGETPAETSLFLEESNFLRMPLSDRIGTVRFLRGDAAAAEQKYVRLVPQDFFSREAPQETDAEFQQLGVIAGIAIAVQRDPIPEEWTVCHDKTSLPAGEQERLTRMLQERHAISSTGEPEPAFTSGLSDRMAMSGESSLRIFRTAFSRSVPIPEHSPEGNYSLFCHLILIWS